MRCNLHDVFVTHDKQLRSVYSLAQYVKTAALLRRDALAALPEASVAVRHLFIGPGGKDVDEPWLRLRLWFAYVYVAIEGWQSLGLTDPTVDFYLNDLKPSGDLECLRRLRNAVFHLQDDPASEKFDDVLGWGVFDGTVSRIGKAQDALERYFRNWREGADLSVADSWS